MAPPRLPQQSTEDLSVPLTQLIETIDEELKAEPLAQELKETIQDLTTYINDNKKSPHARKAQDLLANAQTALRALKHLQTHPEDRHDNLFVIASAYKYVSPTHIRKFLRARTPKKKSQRNTCSNY